jgi:hypothetical protein
MRGTSLLTQLDAVRRSPSWPVRSLRRGRHRPVSIASAGSWYVKFIHMVAVNGDTVNYESKWATLTFQVR